MKRISLVAAVLLAGCATPEAPFDPVADVRYSALGSSPFWMLTIGDDRIVLALGGGAGGRDGLHSHSFPRVLPQVEGDTRQWDAGQGDGAIRITARRAPTFCQSGGRRFEDAVEVVLGTRMLEGCGGRMIARGSR